MARYYQPKHGVFLSVDPELGADISVGINNGYNYSDNNPIIFIDNDGTRIKAIKALAGAIKNIVKKIVNANPGGKSKKFIMKTFSNSTFQSTKLLNKHWSKHKKEFKGYSKADYVRRAQEIARSNSKRIYTKKKRDGSGDYVKFHRDTGEILFLTKNGKIKTLFKPKWNQKNRLKKARHYFYEQ